jgi:hypothetical protein
VLRLLFTFLAFSSYAAGAEAVPGALAGSWTLREAFAGKLPSECRNARLVFTSDGKLIALSGELRFVTKISVKRRDAGFIVHQDFLEHNSKANCQGKSGEYMLSRFVQDIYFERNGAFLRQYIWTKETGRFIEFVRTLGT